MPTKKDNEPLNFEFVNVWCDKEENGKKKSHKRIPVSQVKEWQHSNGVDNYNCFASVQKFIDAKIPAEDKRNTEFHTSPLFFDLDFEDDPSVAQAEMVKIIDFFTKELDLQPFDFQVFFSGSKGFHLIISEIALGIEPGTNLQKIFKWIASFLIHKLGNVDQETGEKQLLQSIDIFSVYTLPRVLRLNNSKHGKTDLYKIELNIEELTALSLAEIKDLAKNPRREDSLKYKGVDRQEIRKRSKASQFYLERAQEYIEAAATASTRYNRNTFSFSKDRMPVCVEDIYNNGWKKAGDRNNATVQLACYFKDAGFTKDETLEKLVPWVKKFTSASSDYEKEQRASNTRHVVYSIFALDAEYKFDCSFIRSLHGAKNGVTDRNYERVPCAGALCHCLQKNSKQDDPPIPLHLASTGNAALTGKRVETKVMIAGKKHTPFIVPQKIEYSCWGHKGCKKFTCPLYQIPSHTCYKDLTVIDRELIECCGVGDDNVKGIIKKMSGIPACTKYDITVTESINVDELLVIPMADDISDNKDFEDSNSGKYVLRKVYAIGGIKINENKYYKIVGYVYPDPKKQEATLAIESVEPLQDIVDKFALTPEIKESLKIFRPKNYETVETINKKLETLFMDLTYNVTHIVKRDELLLALMLVYHSVLRLNVPWSNTPIRGWVECVVIGETETGKSTLIRDTMNYIGLGQMISAESTTRTGLMYKMEQNGSGGAWYIVWGAWPLADKELVWIDEFQEIKKEDYGEMTQARSDGKLVVKRAVTSETLCRVRAILTGNPKDKDGNELLGNYGSGCQSLESVLGNADIRRFDFGVFCKKSDVRPEETAKILGNYPVFFPPEVLRNNILFAWSRTPDQVELPLDTVQKILDVSAELTKIYGNAISVPLVSTADQRNKVARLAVSLAALTQSVDEAGEKIIVYPAHVEYIKHYLKAVYNAPGCGLNQYARVSVREEELTDEKFDKLTEQLQEMIWFKNELARLRCVNLFATCNGGIRQGDFNDMIGEDKDTGTAIRHQLFTVGFIRYNGLGIVKTPKFNSYINKCFQRGELDSFGTES